MVVRRRRRNHGPNCPFGREERGRSVGGVLLDDEVPEAPVVLVARRTAFEVRAHARDLPIGVRFGQFELDVAIELLEALLAGQLGAGSP
jgi:hypothetical protein